MKVIEINSCFELESGEFVITVSGKCINETNANILAKVLKSNEKSLPPLNIEVNDNECRIIYKVDEDKLEKTKSSIEETIKSSIAEGKESGSIPININEVIGDNSNGIYELVNKTVDSFIKWYINQTYVIAAHFYPVNKMKEMVDNIISEKKDLYLVRDYREYLNVLQDLINETRTIQYAKFSFGTSEFSNACIAIKKEYDLDDLIENNLVEGTIFND